MKRAPAKTPHYNRAGDANLKKAMQLCYVSGCQKTVDGTKFCDDHKFKPPANIGRLTGGRA